MSDFKKNDQKKLTETQLKELIIFVLANLAWCG